MKDVSATLIPFTFSVFGLLWKVGGGLSYNHTFRMLWGGNMIENYKMSQL